MARFLQSGLAETVGSETRRTEASSHNPGASRSPPGALPPTRPGRPGSRAARQLMDWRGAGTRQPGERGPAGRRGRGRSDPKHQEIILYDHPEAEIFFKKRKLFSVVF